MTELHQTNTEIEELRAQIQELKAAIKKRNPFDNWFKIGGAVVALLTVIAGVYQYVLVTNNGFRKTIWTEQYALYQEACSAAAEISMASTIREVEKARREFWYLYWGKLSILEHPNVKKAMVDYGNQLYLVQDGKSAPSSLRLLSYTLARECRKSLKETWNPADIGDLQEAEEENL